MIEIPPSAISTWGGAIIFVNVLVTRLGIPIPAAPVLLLAGTAITHGALSFWPVLGAAVLGALLGDGVWFTAGRMYGAQLINGIARLSLPIGTRVQTARKMFERFGSSIVAVSKFIPGLAIVTPPLMGTTRVAPALFVAWDALGATAWAAFWLLGGAMFEHQLSLLVTEVRAHGATVIDLILAVSLGYFLFLCLRRWRYRRWLVAVQICPDQLEAMMHATVPPMVLDARPAALRTLEPHRMSSALPLDLTSPEQVDAALLTHDVVVYCVCPDNATALQVSRQMRHKGFRRIRALKGGLDAWERRGYPVEPLPSLATCPPPRARGATAAPPPQHAVTLRGVAPRRAAA